MEVASWVTHGTVARVLGGPLGSRLRGARWAAQTGSACSLLCIFHTWHLTCLLSHDDQRRIRVKGNSLTLWPERSGFEFGLHHMLV